MCYITGLICGRKIVWFCGNPQLALPLCVTHSDWQADYFSCGPLYTVPLLGGYYDYDGPLN